MSWKSNIESSINSIFWESLKAIKKYSKLVLNKKLMYLLMKRSTQPSMDLYISPMGTGSWKVPQILSLPMEKYGLKSRRITLTIWILVITIRWDLATLPPLIFNSIIFEWKGSFRLFQNLFWKLINFITWVLWYDFNFLL